MPKRTVSKHLPIQNKEMKTFLGKESWKFCNEKMKYISRVMDSCDQTSSGDCVCTNLEGESSGLEKKFKKLDHNNAKQKKDARELFQKSFALFWAVHFNAFETCCLEDNCGESDMMLISKVLFTIPSEMFRHYSDEELGIPDSSFRTQVVPILINKYKQNRTWFLQFFKDDEIPKICSKSEMMREKPQEEKEEAEETEGGEKKEKKNETKAVAAAAVAAAQASEKESGKRRDRE